MKSVSLFYGLLRIRESPGIATSIDLVSALCNKQKAETKFIDVAIPGDSRISQKSIEKRDRYRDLSVVVGRLWNTSISVVPVIVGALGSIPTNLHQSLTSIGLTSAVIPVIQKSVLLSTSRILRHYLF